MKSFALFLFMLSSLAACSHDSSNSTPSVADTEDSAIFAQKTANQCSATPATSADIRGIWYNVSVGGNMNYVYRTKLIVADNYTLVSMNCSNSKTSSTVQTQTTSSFTSDAITFQKSAGSYKSLPDAYCGFSLSKGTYQYKITGSCLSIQGLSGYYLRL